MSISLLISGNLTGFGRFFTSPAAKVLLGKERISLDNHNYLTFLAEGEKAYSITFASNYVAISQYAQILDSFRRPGKLVVTVLVPHNQTIRPKAGSPKGAVYTLLTRVSDRFFAENFRDGMINQNPVVLGQDYYTEILDEYMLESADHRRIDISPSSRPKVGYVHASEAEIPSYLDTPYRKSYGAGGYNLVFFTQSAPKDTPNSIIEEEPEEVILYRVHILNEPQHDLPNPVRLTAPIHQRSANLGEKPLVIDGTYEDAINHRLAPHVWARIVPGQEIIEVRYHFELEKKTVKFVFVDRTSGAPIPLVKVLPKVVFPNGGKPELISSETYTFQGKEIYDKKTLETESHEYFISPLSETLDLARMGDGQEHIVYVERGFILQIPDSKWTYTFCNPKTGEEKVISQKGKVHLSGDPSDWLYSGNSDKWEVPEQPLLIENGEWQPKNHRPKMSPSNPVKKTIQPNQQSVAARQATSSESTFSLKDSPAEEPAPPRFILHRHNWIKVAIVALIPIIMGLLIWGISMLSSGGEKESAPVADNSGKETPEELCCALIYYDSGTNDKQPKRDTLTDQHSGRFRFELTDSKGTERNNNLQKNWLEQDGKKFLVHKITLPDDEGAMPLTLVVSYVTKSDPVFQLVNRQITRSDCERGDTLGVNLGVLLSQLKWYDEMSEPGFKFTVEAERAARVEQIVKMPASDYRRALVELLSDRKFVVSIVVEQPKKKNPDSGKTSPPTPAATGDETMPQNLTENSSITLKDLKDCLNGSNGKERLTGPRKTRAEAMVAALEKVGQLKEAPTAGLDATQRSTIIAYNELLVTKNSRPENYKFLKRERDDGRLISFSQIARTLNVIKENQIE